MKKKQYKYPPRNRACGDIDNWSIKSYIQAAKDLCYPKEVVAKLEKAQNDIEATRIMATARHEAAEAEERRKKQSGKKGSVL